MEGKKTLTLEKRKRAARAPDFGLENFGNCCGGLVAQASACVVLVFALSQAIHRLKSVARQISGYISPERIPA
jgi:hypothetical protein